MGRRIEIICMVVFLLLSAVAISITVDDGVDAVGEPDITIAVSQKKQTAYVAPGQDGILTFTGTVFVEMPYAPNVQYLVVQLSADAGSWPVSVPPALTFSSSEKQQSFSISVQVPIGTSSAITRNLTVSGRWSYSPGVQSGDVDPVTSLILVKQYHAYDVSCEEPFQEIERDDRVGFEIDIANEGNGLDKIEINIDNLVDLSNMDLTFQFSDDEIDVDEDTIQQVNLFITSSSATRLGIYDIELSIHSSLAEELGETYMEDTYTLHLEVVKLKTITPSESDPEPDPDPEPQPDPKPEPEAQPDPETEPEPGDPVEDDPFVEDPGVENDSGSDDDQESDGSSSITIPIAIIIVVVLLVGLCVGIYFFIRSTGRKRND